jgi:hypothetical protein
MAFSWSSVDQREKKKIEHERQLKDFLRKQADDTKRRYFA